MYTLVFQKNEGDSPQFPLTEQLCTFLKQTKAKGIIIFPGYLSCTENSIEWMLKKFFKDTDIVYFGMGNPCKVETKENNNRLTSSESLSQHKDKLKKALPKAKWLEIKRNNQSDHSKLLAIFNLTSEDTELPTPIQDEKSCEDFLSKIKIIGMVIGSSNFSETTYYGRYKNNSKADKGETDLFMFFGNKDGTDHEYEENEKFAEAITDLLDPEKTQNAYQHQYQMILFENKTKVPQDYFKKILKGKLIKTIREVN